MIRAYDPCPPVAFSLSESPEEARNGPSRPRSSRTSPIRPGASPSVPATSEEPPPARGERDPIGGRWVRGPYQKAAPGLGYFR